MNWYPQNSPIRPYQKQEVWFYKPAFLGYPGCHSCNLKWLVTLAKMRGEELVMGWLVDSQAGSKRFTLQVGSASPFINLTVDGGIWAISKDQTTRGQRKMMVGGDTGILPKWPWIGLRLHNKFAQIGSLAPHWKNSPPWLHWIPLWSSPASLKGSILWQWGFLSKCPTCPTRNQQLNIIGPTCQLAKIHVFCLLVCHFVFDVRPLAACIYLEHQGGLFQLSHRWKSLLRGQGTSTNLMILMVLFPWASRLSLHSLHDVFSTTLVSSFNKAFQLHFILVL